MGIFDDLTKTFSDLFDSEAPTIILSMQKQVLRTAEQMFVESESKVAIAETATTRSQRITQCIKDAEAFWKEALGTVKASGDWVASPKKPISDADAKELRVLVNHIDVLNVDAVIKLQSKMNALLDACGYAKT